VYPRPDHGWFTAEHERAERAGRAVPRHVADRARFLYETQAAYYARFARAVRATGYRGALVASNWQAGAGPTHYYNLAADAAVGFVDRHNYAGGGTGHTLVPGPVDDAPGVARPGSGLLGTGMQAVAGRPFAVSEWMGLPPNQWTAESAPTVAVYGMGLQGWDASFAFASNQAGVTDALQAPGGGVYNGDSPLHVTLYPALARLVHRGDVRAGPVVSERRVHVPSLATRPLGFRDAVAQVGDVKAFAGGAAPAEALAAGRVVVRLADAPPRAALHLDPALDTLWRRDAGGDSGEVRSATGQLAWRYGGGRGYWTANTPGTRAVVGFAGGRTHALGAVRLRLETPFAVAFVTSLDRDRPVERARRVLVTAVARARNTGMRLGTDSAGAPRLLAAGGAPVLMEPVRLALHVDRAGPPPVVHVLDHAGRRTGRTLPVRDGEALLDGAATHALYYELDYGGAAR
jgi:hypothetical protein